MNASLASIHSDEENNWLAGAKLTYYFFFYFLKFKIYFLDLIFVKFNKYMILRKTIFGYRMK